MNSEIRSVSLRDIKVIRSVEDGLVEIELSGGRLYRGNPVGPQAWALIFAAKSPPEEPKEEQVNEAGIKTYISLPPDDPRYQAYLREEDAYNQMLQEVGWLNFFDGVLEVPEDWDIPRGHRRAGVRLAEDPDERLIQYIRLEIVRCPADSEILSRAIRNEIEEAEVEAAARLFPGDAQQETAPAGAQQERD